VPKLKRYLLLAVLVLVSGSIAIFFRARVPVPAVPLSQPVAHLYKNKDVSIARIRVKAFYAVPRDAETRTDPNWKDELSAALEKSAAFHALQFRGSSKLSYDIFPAPVLLAHDEALYDTTSTSDGNPHALINVGEEIERRVFRKSGDLYDETFAASDPHEYAVMAILYEGVGASGGEIYQTTLQSASQIAKKLGLPESIIYIVGIDSVSGFFIVNRNYLAKDPLAISGTSVFYHEFAHTIGLPDLFDNNNAPFLNDIMGRGREKPIENTYIDRNFLKAMGVF